MITKIGTNCSTCSNSARRGSAGFAPPAAWANASLHIVGGAFPGQRWNRIVLGASQRLAAPEALDERGAEGRKAPRQHRLPRLARQTDHLVDGVNRRQPHAEQLTTGEEMSHIGAREVATGIAIARRVEWTLVPRIARVLHD